MYLCFSVALCLRSELRSFSTTQRYARTSYKRPFSSRHRPNRGVIQARNNKASYRGGTIKKKLHRDPQRRWGKGVCSFKSEEFRIVKILSRDYDIKTLCSIMRVSRSGYYKWTKTSKKPSSKNEMDIVKCVYGFRIIRNAMLPRKRKNHLFI